MSLLCEYDRGADYEGNFTFSDEFLDFIDKVKPEILLRNCGFSFSEESDCTKLFTPLIADEGICYSFNILDRSEIFQESVTHYQDFHKSDNATNWSLEGGYTSDAGYPSRTFSAAVSKGLSLNIFLPDDDLDLACISSVRGYKILVHAPTDIPLLGEEYIRVSLSQSVVVVIQPYMITTSSSIKKYSPKKRGCYFREERYLKYFQTYTAESCKLECLTNFTLEFCGCVHFFMPRENNTKICGSANITCMEKVDSTSAVYTDEDCDCLLRCSDLNYEVSMSASEINYIYAARKASRFNNTYYMTSLTFYFQSDDFITSQRNEFYGPTDFLPNLGELVG
ncbi:ASC domain containing protein, partial [Asbolus verrucosus]